MTAGAGGWDPRFADGDPRFDAIAAAAHAFAADTEWPPVETWSARLAAHGLDVPVAFVAQHAPIRRRGDARAPYDAEVIGARRVPSRERSWHDFLNMLVWASFPKTKAALHARQLDAAAREDSAAGPRGRERDALSMLDEGSLLLAADAAVAPEIEGALAAHDVDRVTTLRAAGECRPIVFGHALLEHLVLARPAEIFAAVLVVPVAGAGADAIDRAAAALAADPSRLRSPRDLHRLPLGWARAASRGAGADRE